MNESEIVAKLKASVTPPPDNVLATVAPPEPINGQATIAPEFSLDELTQYKLHDYFGEEYKQSDEVKRQQAQYIYDKVTEMVHAPEYGFVIAKIRDLEQMLGTFSSEDRLYKLYQWLKLENVRKGIDAEMGALQNG